MDQTSSGGNGGTTKKECVDEGGWAIGVRQIFQCICQWGGYDSIHNSNKMNDDE